MPAKQAGDSISYRVGHFARGWFQEPLRAGRFDPSGVVFLGDGAWGVSTREIGRDQGGKQAWYLARAESQNHAIIVTLDGPHQHVLVINGDGAVIDEYPSRPMPQSATLQE